MLSQIVNRVSCLSCYPLTWLACCLLLSGCFASGAKVSRLKLGSKASTSSADFRLEEQAKSGLTRLRFTDEDNYPPIFAIKLKTCGSNIKKENKLGGQSRQLLIGFEELSIQSQTLKSDPKDFVQTVASANLDDSAIALVNLTWKENECLLDLCLFSRLDASSVDAGSPEANNSEHSNSNQWWQDDNFLIQLAGFTKAES